jgi:hypothetical protein
MITKELESMSRKTISEKNEIRISQDRIALKLAKGIAPPAEELGQFLENAGFKQAATVARKCVDATVETKVNHREERSVLIRRGVDNYYDNKERFERSWPKR